MTAGGACPLCALGFLTTLTVTTWLRCSRCCVSFDNHGHAYDRDWRQLTLPT